MSTAIMPPVQGRKDKRKLRRPISLDRVLLPVEDITISAEPKAVFVTVTPEMAAHWLERNTENRTIRDSHVSQIAFDMECDKWKVNGETIVFDIEGRLINGQHRCWACIEAGKSFRTLLVTGIESDAYSTIDIGRTKVLPDFLGPVNHEKNVYLLAATLKHVYLWVHGRLDSKECPSKTALLDLRLEHLRLPEAVNKAASLNTTRKLLTASFMALILYAGMLENKQAKAEMFMENLGDGLGLLADSPVYQLRKFLLSQQSPSPGHRRAGQMYVLALAIKAWNAYKNDMKIKLLRMVDGEAYPQL